MTKFKRITTVMAAALLSLLAAAVGPAKSPHLFNNIDQLAMNKWVDSVFNSLSPEARIGQLIVADITPKSNDAVRDQVRRLDVASWVVPHSVGPRFPGPLLIRTRCPDTSPNSTL